jgi:hypothetical protein
MAIADVMVMVIMVIVMWPSLLQLLWPWSHGLAVVMVSGAVVVAVVMALLLWPCGCCSHRGHGCRSDHGHSSGCGLVAIVVAVTMAVLLLLQLPWPCCHGLAVVVAIIVAVVVAVFSLRL